MKKYIITLIACALAAVSCEIKDEYYVSNVNDLVTVKDKTSMISDYGVQYTITKDNTDQKWSVGVRYMINFDIENTDYEITLHDYTPCVISTPTEMGETPSAGEDPVTVMGSTISGGYVNLNFKYYQAKGSDFLHRVFMEYKDDPTAGTLDLYLIHDGNGENPSKIAADDLETVECIYSFPIWDIVPKGQSRMVNLTLYELNGIIVEKNTHRLYNETITF